MIDSIMRIRKIVLAFSLLLGILAVCIAVITQPFVQHTSSQILPVDPKRLESHVKHLSVDLYPRSYDRTRNIELAAQYISSELRNAGCAVSTQEVLVQEAKYKNIVVKLGPASGPVLVIGAHYDSHGDPGATHDRRGYAPDTHTPGADDNASGVAGLIELGRLLCKTSPA